MTHDVVLYLEGNGVEILFLFEENCSTVMLPKVSKVRFYLLPKVNRDVLPFPKRLVSNLLNENEPSLQQVLIVAETVVFQSHNHFNESIHHNREQRDTDNLDQ